MRPGDCDGLYWLKPNQQTLHFPELEDPDGVSVCPSTISLRATERSNGQSSGRSHAQPRAACEHGEHGENATLPIASTVVYSRLSMGGTPIAMRLRYRQPLAVMFAGSQYNRTRRRFLDAFSTSLVEDSHFEVASDE